MPKFQPNSVERDFRAVTVIAREKSRPHFVALGDSRPEATPSHPHPDLDLDSVRHPVRR